MNKFTQHIPNYCDGFERKVFEFSDLDDLALKLGGYVYSLVYDDGHLLSLSKGGTEWRVIGRVDKPVEGLAKWRGSPHTVVEIESVHGWGLDTFEPQSIGNSFTIYSKEDIKLYWGFKNTIMGELKDGRCFLGVDK